MTQDYIVRAIAGNQQIRAFAAFTKRTVETARDYHQTSPVATAALGRLLTAAAMMGSMMKNDKDMLTLQVKGDGPLGTILVTADSKANVKGYVHYPQADVPLKSSGKLDVSRAVGKGSIYIIRDTGLKEPYVGQTEIVSGEIADDLTYYYANSEQIPSVIALGVLVDRDYSVRQSGGVILQLMPGASEETIKLLESNLEGIPSVTKLLDQEYSPEMLLQEFLKGMDIKITDRLPVKYTCNCSRERVERALFSIGKDELNEIIKEGEPVELQCHFCNKKYQYSIEEIQAFLISGHDK